MKRTCLHKNTTCPDLSGNADEQTTCDLEMSGASSERVFNRDI